MVYIISFHGRGLRYTAGLFVCQMKNKRNIQKVESLRFLVFLAPEGAAMFLFVCLGASRSRDRCARAWLAIWPRGGCLSVWAPLGRVIGARMIGARVAGD